MRYMDQGRTVELSVGVAKSRHDASLHSVYSLCPNDCGNRLSPMGQRTTSNDAVYRLCMRCRHCKLLVMYDYTKGSAWEHNLAATALELAADPESSTILTAADLLRGLGDQEFWLSQKKPQEHTGEEYDSWQSTIQSACERSLQILLELEKLDPEEASRCSPDKQALITRFIEVGGTLPASLAVAT